MRRAAFVLVLMLASAGCVIESHQPPTPAAPGEGDGVMRRGANVLPFSFPAEGGVAAATLSLPNGWDWADFRRIVIRYLDGTDGAWVLVVSDVEGRPFRLASAEDQLIERFGSAGFQPETDFGPRKHASSVREVSAVVVASGRAEIEAEYVMGDASEGTWRHATASVLPAAFDHLPLATPEGQTHELAITSDDSLVGFFMAATVPTDAEAQWRVRLDISWPGEPLEDFSDSATTWPYGAAGAHRDSHGAAHWRTCLPSGDFRLDYTLIESTNATPYPVFFRAGPEARALFCGA